MKPRPLSSIELLKKVNDVNVVLGKGQKKKGKMSLRIGRRDQYSGTYHIGRT